MKYHIESNMMASGLPPQISVKIINVLISKE